MECTKIWAIIKVGQQIRISKSIFSIKKCAQSIALLLILLSISYLTACQPRLYEGATVAVLATETPLLDVNGFQISPNGKYIVMNVVEKTDDTVDMHLPTEAAELARSLGKGKIQVMDLNMQTKLLEFTLTNDDITDHYPTDFAWSPDSSTVYYRNDGLPSIVKLHLSTGERTAYYFPYARFNVHPESGIIIGWGDLVKKSEQFELYDTVYTNRLVTVDPLSMLVFQEIVFADVSLVLEATWRTESDEILIRDGLSLYRYGLTSETPVLYEQLPYITQELRSSYNPLANLFLLEEREKNSKRYLIYDPTIDCIILQISVDTRLSSPIWHNKNQVIALRTNEDRSVHLERLTLNSLGADMSQQCIH